ncbi:MAG: nucleotidyltransferase domain-containing protein [Firmicutes bacterium]|nr:nucleotidyltransferase domain-containing protein [Bacillota bacterium]
MRERERVERLKERLGPICGKRGAIVAVYLFGSYATAEKTPSSDIDLGVIYRRPPELMEELALEAEIAKVLGTERFDLINLNKARIDLQFPCTPYRGAHLLRRRTGPGRFRRDGAGQERCSRVFPAPDPPGLPGRTEGGLRRWSTSIRLPRNWS